MSNRMPSTSERAVRIIVVLVFIGGVLSLIALAAYAWIEYGDFEPRSTEDVRETGIFATATAACDEFQSQFPGTPCPQILKADLVATATAACAEFLSQFPGTPCPTIEE